MYFVLIVQQRKIIVTIRMVISDYWLVSQNYWIETIFILLYFKDSLECTWKSFKYKDWFSTAIHQ